MSFTQKYSHRALLVGRTLFYSDLPRCEVPMRSFRMTETDALA